MKKPIIATVFLVYAAASSAISLGVAVDKYPDHPALIESHIEGIIEGYRFARVMEFDECDLGKMKGPQLTPLVITDLQSGKHSNFKDYGVALSVGMVLVERFPCLKGKLFGGNK